MFLVGDLLVGGKAGELDRGDVLDSHVVLDKPFVDCFCWVGHEDSTPEVGLCKHVWK